MCCKTARVNHLDICRALEGSSQLLFFWGETQRCCGATIWELRESIFVAMNGKLPLKSGIVLI
jgi:hypothetical protein